MYVKLLTERHSRTLGKNVYFKKTASMSLREGLN
jgi:hypothetical protein